MAVRKFYISLLLCMTQIITMRAQLFEHLSDDCYFMDTTQLRVLSVELDALTFFRDNEYNSSLTKGYSLPGLWITPKLEYNPNHDIHLELGFNALMYNGANKYPNYAYHDISTWKGQQYQSGAHLKPWFRAQLNTEHFTYVLGNIYGGSNHKLTEVMFNPEQNISADPETGFQILIDYDFMHFDTWINWQSYIFEEDSHQEAFTVGANINFLLHKNKRLKLSIPIQALAQHRGGEQNIVKLGVQTLINGMTGIAAEYDFKNNFFRTLNVNLGTYGCFQQSGKLWPKSTGHAYNAEASLNVWKYFNVKYGYFRAPKYYANLFGSPLFSTYSIKTNSELFRGMTTHYLRLDYSRTYHNNYIIGANIDIVHNKSQNTRELNSSFGIYLKLKPSFMIKAM